MGPTIIARNYAETLLTLAERHGGDSAVDGFGTAISDVAELLESEPLLREFLETPRIDVEDKKRALQASFGGRVPDPFLRFLLVVLDKRRPALLRLIAAEYQHLVDEARGRARAEITLAREADDQLRAEIVGSLQKRLGRSVVPVFRVDNALIGGVVIRVGGEILDGSLRRRAAGLRRRMLESTLPAAAEGGSEF